MQKDNQDFSSYLSDGLHLSPKGNEFVFSHLWPLIEKKVSSLPLRFPYWRDVAEATPERSLLGEETSRPRPPVPTVAPQNSRHRCRETLG